MVKIIFILFLLTSLQGCTQDTIRAAVKFPSNNNVLRPGLIHEWNFTEGSGQWVYNTLGGNTNKDNYIGAYDHQFNTIPFFTGDLIFAQCTVTENFANNRDGLPIAAHLTTLAGAVPDGGTGVIPSFRKQGYVLPAGTYTISVDVKSNTGSSQTMRIESPITNNSTDITITTSWNRVSFVVTSSGSAQHYFFVENGSGGTPLDILIYGIKINAGSSATTYQVPRLDFWFGETSTTEAVDPTWIAGKGIATTDQYGYAVEAVADTPITQFTIYTVGKLSSGATQQSWLVSERFGANRFSMIWGDAASSGSIITPRFMYDTITVTTKLANLSDNNTHIVCGTYNGVDLKIYIDKVLLGVYNRPGLPAIKIERLLLAGMILVGNVSFNGEIYYISMYNQAHSQSQVNQNYSSLVSKMTGRSIAVNGLTKFVMFDGDSISDIGGNGLFPLYAMRELTTPQQGQDVAVIGSTLTDLNARASTVDSYYDATRTVNVLSIFIGANDLSGVTTAATFVANLKTYCLARKAVGWKINLCTLLPNVNAGFNAKRNAANTIIYGDPTFYDALSDFAANATMGPDGAYSNTTYYIDGVHPTVAGHLILAPIVKTALETLL